MPAPALVSLLALLALLAAGPAAAQEPVEDTTPAPAPETDADTTPDPSPAPEGEATTDSPLGTDGQRATGNPDELANPRLGIPAPGVTRAFPLAALRSEGVIGYLNTQIDQTTATARRTVLDVGWAMWFSVAGIMLVWHGIRIALAGDARAHEVLSIFMSIITPAVMLNFYTEPIPLAGMTFPQVVAGLGPWMMQQMGGTAVFVEAFNHLGDLLMATQGHAMDMITPDPPNTPQPEQGIMSKIWNGFTGTLDIVLAPFTVLSKLKMMMISLAMTMSAILVGCLALLLGWAHIIYASVATALVVMFGPLFIPLMPIPKFQFLSENWLRMLLGYGLYAGVTIVAFQVVMQFLIEALFTFMALMLDVTGSAMLDTITMNLVVLVVGISGIYIMMSVPKLANGFLTGSADSGSIGSAIMSGIMAIAQAPAALMAASTGVGAVAGSAATAMQRTFSRGGISGVR